MIRRVATEQEAFDQACMLRRWYDVLSIEGPEGGSRTTAHESLAFSG
jgi:hypothetical protein